MRAIGRLIRSGSTGSCTILEPRFLSRSCRPTDGCLEPGNPGELSADAIKLEGKDAPPPGYEVVPTEEGKALVDYLLSRKKTLPLAGSS